MRCYFNFFSSILLLEYAAYFDQWPPLRRTCRQRGKEIGPPPCAVNLRVCGENPCVLRDRQPAESDYRKWGDWSRWSECTNQCGTGVRTRKRSCVAGNGFFATTTRKMPTACGDGDGAARQERICNEGIWRSLYVSSVLIVGTLVEVGVTS